MSCRNPCKECPCKIKTRDNTVFRKFAERTGNQHKCHMIDTKDIWNPDNKNICVGTHNINNNK